MRVIHAALLACLMAPAGAQGAGAPVALSDAWAKAWSAKSLSAMLDLYAPEPVFLPASGERWEGRDVITAHFIEGLTQFDSDLKLHSLHSEASGDLAYDSGTYSEKVTPARGGRAAELRGNYLFIFQRQTDGTWKILEQSFSEFDPSKL